MALVAGGYTALCVGLFCLASLRQAPPRVIVELALCSALGMSSYIGLDHGATASFWMLLAFGPFVAFPIRDWTRGSG